jgi:hypothetical protein
LIYGYPATRGYKQSAVLGSSFLWNDQSVIITQHQFPRSSLFGFWNFLTLWSNTIAVRCILKLQFQILSLYMGRIHVEVRQRDQVGNFAFLYKTFFTQ